MSPVAYKDKCGACRPILDGKQPPAKRRAVPDADGAPTAHPPAAPGKQGDIAAQSAIQSLFMELSSLLWLMQL